MPHIDHGIGYQLYPVVALLDVFKTPQQSFERILPRTDLLDTQA